MVFLGWLSAVWTYREGNAPKELARWSKYLCIYYFGSPIFSPKTMRRDMTLYSLFLVGISQPLWKTYFWWFWCWKRTGINFCRRRWHFQAQFSPFPMLIHHSFIRIYYYWRASSCWAMTRFAPSLYPPVKLIYCLRSIIILSTMNTFGISVFR